MADNLKTAKTGTLSSVLCRVAGGQGLHINALDVYDGRTMIDSGIVVQTILKAERDQKNLDRWLSDENPATPDCLVDMYELESEAPFYRMFTEISGDLDKVVLSKTQILRFCELYPQYLCTEHTDNVRTLFLIKEDGDFTVVGIKADKDKKLSSFFVEFKHEILLTCPAQNVQLVAPRQ